jgi:hypothetical protein
VIRVGEVTRIVLGILRLDRRGRPAAAEHARIGRLLVPLDLLDLLVELVQAPLRVLQILLAPRPVQLPRRLRG